MNYYAIKSNFLRGLWNAAMVTMAKRKGIITAVQYKEILHEGVEAEVITAQQYEALTGEAYSA
ncbi:MAG: XkdX family protein [Firmicutes bacterium]|nr:XkdX family protein [Bacillota bacterium]